MMNLCDYNFNPHDPIAFAMEAIRIFGIDSNISYSFEKKQVLVDFNTGAKSGLYLHIPEDDSLPWFSTRYEEKVNIENLCDLLYQVKDCMHGREYVGEKWLQAMIEHGIIQVKDKQVREIVF